jgi:hypothetical protein
MIWRVIGSREGLSSELTYAKALPATSSFPNLPGPSKIFHRHNPHHENLHAIPHH